MRLFTTLAATVLALALVAPMALGDATVPVDPMLNGDFELYAETTGSGGSQDGALGWAHTCESSTTFTDLLGDGDQEAVIYADKSVCNHNMWQSIGTPGQAITADFDAFEYDIEQGTIAGTANNKIGLAFSPAYSQHPFVGVFYEGAIVFDDDDIRDSAEANDGRVSLNPVEDGRMACAYPPACEDLAVEYNSADDERKKEILSQTRIVQISFWNFNRQDTGFIAIDNVAFEGAPTVAEEIALNQAVTPNPCIDCLPDEDDVQETLDSLE